MLKGHQHTRDTHNNGRRIDMSGCCSNIKHLIRCAWLKTFAGRRQAGESAGGRHLERTCGECYCSVVFSLSPTLAFICSAERKYVAPNTKYNATPHNTLESNMARDGESPNHTAEQGL